MAINLRNFSAIYCYRHLKKPGFLSGFFFTLLLLYLPICAYSDNSAPNSLVIPPLLKNIVYCQQQSCEKITLAQAMQKYHVPAISITMVKHNHIVWSYAAENTGINSLSPINTQTLFQAGTLSQPITALFALKLIDENRLPLHDDISPWLKTWALPKQPVYKNIPVTISELLSMSSGLNIPYFSGYLPDHPLPKLKEILQGQPPANNPPLKFLFEPATHYAYSSGGYVVTQFLIQNITGNFNTAANTEIFQPLQMKHSYFLTYLPPNLTTHIAKAHNAQGKPFTWPYRVFPELAASGLWTTSQDLAHYVIAMMQARQYQPDAILSPWAARMAFYSQINTPYGLGFLVIGHGKSLQFMATGKSPGYRCAFIGYPLTGNAIIIMTNSDNGDRLIKAIIATLLPAAHNKWLTQ